MVVLGLIAIVLIFILLRAVTKKNNGSRSTKRSPHERSPQVRPASRSTSKKSGNTSHPVSKTFADEVHDSTNTPRNIPSKLSVFTDKARQADGVVIDTETVNSVFGREVIEVGAILLKNGVAFYEFDQLICPLGSVPLSASLFSDIDPGDLISQPSAAEVIPTFIAAIQGLTVIGHNVAYDTASINREADRAQCMRLDCECVDTLDIARSRFPNAPSLSLQEVMHLLGVEETEDHRALSDARWTLECWHRLRLMESPIRIPEATRQRARQRVSDEQRRRTNIFVRSEYFNTHNIAVLNSQPAGKVLRTVECGVEISGEEHHQTLLSGYGYDAWLWVYVTEDLIRSGKYAGYPTYWVYLDGEEIGHISKFQMERHCGQIPSGGAVLLAHIPNRSKDINVGKWQLRLQMPCEHNPVVLSSRAPIVKKPKRIAPTPAAPHVQQRVQQKTDHGKFVNSKPHKKVLETGGTLRTIHLNAEAHELLSTFESGDWIWVIVRVTQATLTVRYKGSVVGDIPVSGDTSALSPEGNVSAATISKNGSDTVMQVELPAQLF